MSIDQCGGLNSLPAYRRRNTAMHISSVNIILQSALRIRARELSSLVCPRSLSLALLIISKACRQFCSTQRLPHPNPETKKASSFRETSSKPHTPYSHKASHHQPHRRAPLHAQKKTKRKVLPGIEPGLPENTDVIRIRSDNRYLYCELVMDGVVIGWSSLHYRTRIEQALLSHLMERAWRGEFI